MSHITRHSEESKDWYAEQTSISQNERIDQLKTKLKALEEVAISRMKGEDELQAKLDKLKELGEKCSKATECFDKLMAGDFVELDFLAKKLVNQIGNEILEIINE